MVREFSATVNGKRRQVLISMPPGYENDVQEAYLILMEEERYWNIFWGIESDVNDYAVCDLGEPLTDRTLRKVRV